MIEKYELRMVTVTDDWFPCYPDNQVRLTIGIYNFGRYYVKLTAWGMDDTGVEICADATDMDDSLVKYNELKKIYDSIPDGVDKYWFIDHGFNYG